MGSPGTSSSSSKSNELQMADERRLQLVDVDEEEETVRVLGLYSRFESLLILSYLKQQPFRFRKYFSISISQTSCCSSSQ